MNATLGEDTRILVVTFARPMAVIAVTVVAGAIATHVGCKKAEEWWNRQVEAGKVPFARKEKQQA